MTRIGNYLSMLFFLLTTSAALAATKPSVAAFVDHNEVGVGETFTVTVSVSSSESVDPQEPRVPNLAGFRLVNSWVSSATSSKLMQGQGGLKFETVHRRDFNYTLTAEEVGRWTIPAFEVVVSGETFYTKPVVINVLKEGTGNSSGSQTPPGMPSLDEIDQAEEMFNQLLQRRAGPPPSARQLPKNPNESFFVQVEVDKTDVYEGEQITANWYIYTRGNILSLDRLKFPDLKGFWKEIIEEVPALNFTQEVLNGIPYRKALLASHALFPIKPGVAVIDEYKIKASLQIPTSPFGSFGLGPTYTFTRSSERVKINVKPLPTEGKPKDFSGAVGQFEVRASVEGKEFPVNQPFSLKIRFEGQGNAKLIDLPAFQAPPQLEVYDTKNEARFFKNGKSYKEFEILLIPRQEGSVTIPAFSASMFDPKTRRYYTRATEPITLKFVPGSGSNPSLLGSSRVSTPTAAAVKKDQLPDILESSTLGGRSKPFVMKILLIVLYVGVFLVLILKARRELGTGEKTASIKEEIHRRLKKVSGALAQGDWRAVGADMTNLYYFVLGELSGQGGANYEIDRLLDLAPPSLRRELGEDFKRQIEIFQALGFAPESLVGALRTPEEMKKNVTEAEKLLARAVVLTDRRN